MSLITIIVTLYVTLNATGNLPIFVAVLRRYSLARQRMIIIREMLFALILMIIFTFFGEAVLGLLHLTIPIVRIAGGVLLFVLALDMVFPKPQTSEQEELVHEPFIVPLATPIMAGPATLSTVMIFASQEQDNIKMITGIFIAWLISTTLLLLGSFLKKILGEKVLLALERLAGLVLTYIAVQMFTVGIQQYTTEAMTAFLDLAFLQQIMR